MNQAARPRFTARSTPVPAKIFLSGSKVKMPRSARLFQPMDSEFTARDWSRDLTENPEWRTRGESASSHAATDPIEPRDTTLERGLHPVCDGRLTPGGVSDQTRRGGVISAETPGTSPPAARPREASAHDARSEERRV